MVQGGIPELLNFKQKGKDMNEFIKSTTVRKAVILFWRPCININVYYDNNIADIFLY